MNKNKKILAAAALLGVLALLAVAAVSAAPQASAAGFDSLEVHYDGTTLVVSGSIQNTNGPLDLLISNPIGGTVSEPWIDPADASGAFYYSWVTSLSNGVGYSVTVTASYTIASGGGNEIKTLYFNVPSVTGVSLPSTLSLTTGGTSTLTPTITPADAADPSVTWMPSSNPSIATVDGSGVVTAVGPGLATISCKTNDGGFTAQCVVTVTNEIVHPTSVSVAPTTLSLSVGGAAGNLTATVLPSNATDQTVTWSSSNTSVATVSASGVVTAVGPGSATISCKTTDGAILSNPSCTVTVTQPPTGLTVSPTTLSLSVGGTTGSLTATVTPSNASNKTVTWSTSNALVATVSSTGVVTAAGPGSATITATSNANSALTATCDVTVILHPTGVAVSPTTASLEVGGNTTLTATVSPSNATDQTVTWSSSNASVATVSASGVVTAVGPGTATISCKTNDGAKASSPSCTVTVIQHVTGVALDYSTLNLNVRDTSTLKATVSPANATDKTVTWSSDDESVAKVSTSGVVTAVGPGTATITVKTNDGGWTDTCVVTVSTVPVTGISLSPATFSVVIGSTYRVTAKISPTNATDLSVTWESSDPSIATVDSNGVVKGVATGTATITATTTDGGYVGSSTATVTNVPPPTAVAGVSLDKTTLTLAVGDNFTLTATVSPSNAANKSVTWSSSDASVATVNNGVVTAVGVGTATITVTTNDGGRTAACVVTVGFGVNLPTDSGYNIAPTNGSSSPVESGGSFSFTLDLAKGDSGSTPVVKWNGNVLEPVNGVYTITNIHGTVDVTVEGVSSGGQSSGSSNNTVIIAVIVIVVLVILIGCAYYFFVARKKI